MYISTRINLKLLKNKGLKEEPDFIMGVNMAKWRK